MRGRDVPRPMAAVLGVLVAKYQGDAVDTPSNSPPIVQTVT
jgi:hypothetical protein